MISHPRPTRSSAVLLLSAAAAFAINSALSPHRALAGAADSPFHWKNPAGGSWIVGANWLENFYPNSVEEIAIFNPVNPTPATVTLDSAITMGELDFQSTQPFTIAPGTNGSLALNGFFQSAFIRATTPAASSITANISLPEAHGLNVSLAGPTTTVLLSGNISGIGPITSTNTGTLTLSGTNTFQGGLSVSEGSVLLNSPGALPANHPLSITAGSVTAANQGTNPKTTLQPSSLTFGGSTNSWTGQLDLTNNNMIVHNGSLDTIANQITQGYNNGTWTGNGITSSSAAASTSPKTALAYASFAGTFDGQPVTTSDVVVKYTVVGDTNLDGSVNFTDLLTVAQHYATTNTTWSTGDFTYDGSTNFSDLLGLAQNYSKSLTLSATQFAQLDEIGGPTFITAFAQAQAQVEIPEPINLCIFVCAGLTFLTQRRALKSNKPAQGTL